MQIFTRITTVLFIAFLAFFSQGQITVTNQTNATTLSQYLAGSNVSVFNASLLGAPLQSGYFTSSSSTLDMPSGVILSSGNAMEAIGPNNSTSTSASMGQPGDASLSALAGFATNDRVELKFDFQVQSDYVEFSYIFASEEYNEFVNSSFNDVFAFYISGPGIVGEQNLAVVPTTTTPVTINSINLQSFWQFYRNNVNGMLTNDVEFDGFTTKMKASKGGLIPCSTYTLRLVLADGSDSALDSWVLLEENSLVQGNVSAISNTPTVDNTALEGCIKASFTFNLNQALTYDTEIDLSIAGSAVNGVDYAGIDNSIVIPAGQTSATIFIDAVADGITEGQENIYLIYEPSPCAETDTIELFINDAQPIDYTLDGTNLTCNGNDSGQIDATITGGFTPYVLTITDPNNQTYDINSTNLPLTGLAAGTYQVAVDDIYGCNGDAQVIGAEYDAGQTFLPDGNGNVYTSTLPIAGFGSGVLTDPNQLQSICLNMEHSSLGEVQIKLIAPNGQTIILKERFNNSDGGHTDMGEPVAIGPVDGGNNDVTPGIGFDYCFTNNPIYGTMVQEKDNYTHTYTDVLGHNLTDHYLPSGSYTPYQNFSQLIGTPLDGNWTIWVKDHNPQDNGYIFSWSLSFTSANSGDIVVLTEPVANTVTSTVTSPACGASTGAINISVGGPNGPFTYLWSTGATTEDISGLAAGTYTVTVTNSNLCTTQASFTVSNATGPAITEVITHELCVDANNGAINITPTGTITSYLWSNGATSEDVSNLSPGNYSVVVTASNGCITSKSFVVNQANPILLSTAVTNEYCGDMEGEIDLSVVGGISPYTYLWSNGATTQDLTDLNQNNYSVTVTDANNCTKTISAQIINLVGQCTPNCDLAINNATLSQETCGNTNGAINLSVFSSNTPVTYSWNTGATTSSLSNLSSGNYTINLQDALGCELTQTYTIVNNAGTLQITNPVITNETCGNNNGSIDISVSGGTGTYTYLWSNGATTQDLTGIPEGTYSVTVTDQANCDVYSSFTVTNQTSGMALTFQYVVNENCNNNQGSIDINLTAGTYTYLWSHGATSQDLMGLNQGSYSCLITNTANGCQLQTPVYTVQNIAGNITMNIIDFDDEYCNQNNGEISVSVSGGQAPYTLLWSNGATTTSLNNLNEGSYTLTVTDASSCQFVSSPIVISNTPGDLSVNVSMTEELCNNDQGQINLTITGGTIPITYAWSNGATTEDLTNLSSGSYTYTVTDVNQCSTSSSVYVSNNSGTLTISSSTITQPTCGVNNGLIDITPTGGNGVYTYSWSNGATTQDLANVSSGIYSVTVTEGTGCSFTQSFTVNGQITFNSASVISDACNASAGSINISLTGGSLPSYTWSNGATTEDISGLVAGTYTVHVSTFEGCTFDSSFVVTASTDCFAMCTGTQSTSSTGTLYDSGNASGNYLNNQLCGFLIDPPCASSITASFVSFNTQAGGDYVRIYDGINASGILLGTFSGTSIPANVTATSGSMFVQFTSNATITSTGFQMNWTSVNYSSAPTASFVVSNANPALGTTVSFTGTTTNSSTWTWDVNGNGSTDFTTQNASYTYSVPGTYIVTYTASNCLDTVSVTQTIVVQGAPQISLSPSSATTYQQSSCGNTAHTFTINNTGTGDLVWSGTNGSYALVPASGTVPAGGSQIVTVSYPSQVAAGSYTYFNTITSNDPLDTTIIDTVYINQTISCLYLMCTNTSSTQSSGTLMDSGGSTGNYLNSQNCGFLIQPSCATSVTANFTSFATQSGIDFVRIYDGINASGILLGTFSGFTIPASVTANSGSMYVQFTSNSSTVYGGFVMNWTSVPYSTPPAANFTASSTNPALGTTVNFTTTDADATSWAWDVNGDGSTDYTTQNASYIYTVPGTYLVSYSATNCIGTTTTTQTIVVQGAPTIAVSPSTTTNYQQTGCGTTTHTFTISNNGTGDLVWTGTNGVYALSPASGTIIPGGSQVVTVIFPAQNAAGTYTYNNTITSNDPSNPTVVNTVIIDQTLSCLYLMCTNTSSTQSSGTLSDSGGTTANYSNNQNCGFLIQPACATSVTASFTSFTTQAGSDILRIYDGVNTSGILLGSFSGSTLPSSVTANSGSMYVQFTSSAATVYSGFVMNWSSVAYTVNPAANFSISDATPALNTTVNFTSTDSDASSWAWDVNGDGSTDYTTQNASYVYTAPGTYTVSYTATNCIGSTTTTQTVVVQGAPSIAISPATTTNYQQTSCGSTTHTFTISNNGTGDLAWTGNGVYPLSPSSGTILPGGSQVVTVIYPTQNAAGTYTYNNTISSNDPVNPTIVNSAVIDQTVTCLYLICTNSSSTQDSGSLSDSGGTTGSYANNQNCGFLIQPACVTSVTANFTAFTTQAGSDIVRIYDGVNASGILLGTFSGFSIPASVTANSGSMYIQFTSSASTVYSGFVMNWTSVPYLTGPAANFTVSDLTPALNSTVNFTTTDSDASSWAWDVNGDGSTDYTTQNASHIYSVPGTYLVSYSATNCLGTTTSTQTIVVQGAPSIAVSPTTSTNYQQPNCGTTTHTFTISNNGTGDLVWSGSNGSFPLSPASGTILPGGSQVVTVNYSSQNTAGTYTYYNTIISNDIVADTIIDTVVIDQTISCLYLMCTNSSTNQGSGTLWDSGGSAGNYANNQNCGFLIQPTCVSTITASFASFATQTGSDFVRIYDGVDATGILLGSFSGFSIPASVIAYSCSMYVQFTSSTLTNYAGFQMNWTSTPPTSPPMANFNISDLNPTVGSTVFFTTPDNDATSWAWDVDGDNNSDYFTENAVHAYSVPGTYIVSFSATNCVGTTTTTQTIVVQGAPIISITPGDTNYFESTCGTLTHSFIIYNTGAGNLNWSGSNSNWVLNPSSGVIPPGGSQTVSYDITHNVAGSYSYISTIFSNDPMTPSITDSVNLQQAVTCLYEMCDQTSSTDETGTLTDSGGLFGNYLDNENCSFLIQPSCNQTITLNFTTFQIESGYDYLTVYDGTDATGILLGQYTGYSLPPSLTATSGAMFITFTTDFSVTVTGFEANWTSVSSTFTVNSNIIQPCGTTLGSIDQETNATIVSYDWSNGSMTQDVSNLSPGNYTCILTSDLGCVVEADYTINNATVFSAGGTVSHASCSTCSDGSINISINNPSDFSFDWSTGETTQNISALNPGNYTLTIADSLGCDTTMTFEVLNTASIKEIENLSFGLEVYPNPSTGIFYADVVLPIGIEGVIILTDVTGKIVAETEVLLSGKYSFDGTTFEEGVYFINLKVGEQNSVKRIVLSQN